LHEIQQQDDRITDGVLAQDRSVEALVRGWCVNMTGEEWVSDHERDDWHGFCI
jgi:hypothetical protein